jgi:hypothetical protein
MKQKFLILAGLFALPVVAADLQLSLELPRINSVEYHRPYVAVWLEPTGAGKGEPQTLLLWYDQKKPNGHGKKWLKDLRQWWRKDGRNLQPPIDGISGATQANGAYKFRFTPGVAPLAQLPEGDYLLSVEAAREVGGREWLKIPFHWPVKSKQELSAQGKTELGRIILQLNP